jgi:DNA-binding MarR family transcriptional regulator
MEPGSDTNFIPSVEFVRAFQRFVGEVFRVNGQLLATADMLARDLDVSAARWQTIAVIRNEPLTAAAIARRLGLSRQSVQQTVNRMQKQRLVELVDNPDHRTSSLVRLTAQGQAVMAILRDRQIQLTTHFTRELGYTATDIDRLTDQLRHMREHAAEIDTLKIVHGNNPR